MAEHQIFRLHNPALWVALAAAFPVLAHAAGAASIDFSTGNVMAVNAAGAQRPLTKGAEVSNGDTIRTGDGGRAQLRFSDGGMVSLQPQTELRIDNYQYAGKEDGQEKGFFSLLKGGMRTITGLVGRGNRDNYKVTTSVATIGIRGTEYTAKLGDGVLHINTGEGAIEVCSTGGCLTLASGESAVVQGGAAPQRLSSRPQLPPTPLPADVQPVYTAGGELGAQFIPTSPMPTTGSATYATIASSTAVVESTGAWTPGTLSSASVTANFGSLTASSSLAGTVNGLPFSATGSGSISGNTLSQTLTGAATGACGASTCSGSMSGTFYGVGPDRVGISYSLTNSTALKTFSGAAVLK